MKIQRITVAYAHPPEAQGLYDPANEHDACGVGFVANIKGSKSHAIVEQGLTILKNLTHRGAVGADPLAGDGAGILVQIPDQFFREEMAKQDVTLPPVGEYGVGMVFLPQEPASRFACEYEIERAIKDEGQVLLGWRDVPCDNEGLGHSVKRIEPTIRQVFIGRGAGVTVTDALERKLYIIRKSSGHAIQALKLAHGKEFYVPSMSARTIVYKGMLLAGQVGSYYKDLQDPRCISALALVHQRFSTNTFPTWDLAHPFRLIAHNGEINTLRGNVNWIRARQGAISSPILGKDLAKLWPLIYDGQSDSASFDNALELLLMSGYSIAHSVMMMIPEAWEGHTHMDPSRRAFYEYHAAMMEPWDGPAAIAFTDGRQIGATLDRNGLRPARYIVTDDDLVIMGSECGCLQIPEERIVKKWRLQPGKMFLVDLEKGRIIDDKELKDTLAAAKPYREWIERIRIRLDDVETDRQQPERSSVSLLDRQQSFAYTQEDLKFIMAPMGANGEEPIGSMGNDSPLAVLSDKSKTLYHYFKQLFAQVTNPPIDPIREELVTSLVSFIGPKPNLLGIDEMNPPIRLEVSHPVLDFYEMEKIRHIERYTEGKFRSWELDICYPAKWGKEAIEARLASLAAQAEDAVRSGYSIIVISDRKVDADHVAIPALLALSAIHQHLTNKGLRTSAGLVVETGSAREVHHFALLGGYGAEAVHPYLALETLLAMHAGSDDPKAGYKAIKNFVKAIGKGLRKVMSKMGISTYMSYTGAQIFEAVGLSRALVDKYFTGTASNVEGIGVFEVAEEAIRVHKAAFGNDPVLANALDAGGEYAFRVRGEEHMWTPDAIAKLQHSTRNNSAQTYKEYAQIINDQSRRHMTFRGLFEFRTDPAKAIPLSEVEPASEIVKRFATGAMSLGSISTEAHATLAVAMNRIGGKSNTGEGGEDRNRYAPIKAGETLASRLGRNRIESDIVLKEGDSLKSKIKQVASGRFGVTAEYLASAEQIQIKMA
ncbi:MAG: glutamate synthase central domain-containing protein, partial [Betaproteobacteria bacterium]